MDQKPPTLPLKFRFLLRLHSFASAVSRRPNATVNRPILNLFDPKTSPSSKPRHGVATRDVVFDPSRKHLWIRIFIPHNSISATASTATATAPPLVVYFHGGGFVFFAADSFSYDELCRRLARGLGAVVVSVNYRLAPECRYPLAYEDGFDGLKLIDGLGSGGFLVKADFGRCFIAGDSAGGNLAHHVAVRAGTHDFNEVKIKGLITIQPFFGGEERTESEIQFNKSPMLNLEQADWFWKAFLPSGSNRNHPAAHVAGDIAAVRFPSTLVIVGGRDQLRDWGRRYYEWLKEGGKEVDLVEYPNAIHGFYAVPQLKDSLLLIKDVSDFMQKCMEV